MFIDHEVITNSALNLQLLNTSIYFVKCLMFSFIHLYSVTFNLQCLYADGIKNKSEFNSV